MAVAVTNAKWENSARGRGVAFDAESEHGKGEFLVAEEALADLARESNMTEEDCLEAFESTADEISEAAGRFISAGASGRFSVITSADLPSLR